MNNTTDRKFHNISLEDREMFAYNAAYQRKQQQLAKVTQSSVSNTALSFWKVTSLKVTLKWQSVAMMVSLSTAKFLTPPKHTSDENLSYADWVLGSWWRWESLWGKDYSISFILW